MDRKTVTVLGAAAALAGSPALAAPAPTEPPVPQAASYADLLQPIPNAVERLKLADAEVSQRPVRLIPAQYDHHHHHNNYNNHHHHHHNNYYNYYRGHSRSWWLRRGYIWSGGIWVIRPRGHHHHHHHHHSNDYNR